MCPAPGVEHGAALRLAFALVRATVVAGRVDADVPGVLDKSRNLIKQLSSDDARALIADGTISGGMIPKVETCLEALENGVEGVVILNGKTPHVVLVELFTEHGAGTLIVARVSNPCERCDSCVLRATGLNQSARPLIALQQGYIIALFIERVGHEHPADACADDRGGEAHVRDRL